MLRALDLLGRINESRLTSSSSSSSPLSEPPDELSASTPPNLRRSSRKRRSGVPAVLHRDEGIESEDPKVRKARQLSNIPPKNQRSHLSPKTPKAKSHKRKESNLGLPPTPDSLPRASRQRRKKIPVVELNVQDKDHVQVGKVVTSSENGVLEPVGKIHLIQGGHLSSHVLPNYSINLIPNVSIARSVRDRFTYQRSLNMILLPRYRL